MICVKLRPKFIQKLVHDINRLRMEITVLKEMKYKMRFSKFTEEELKFFTGLSIQCMDMLPMAVSVRQGSATKI